MCNACNLKCVYCFTGDAKTQQKLQIDLNFAKCALKKYICEEDYREVRFYGIGEPTQAFSQMKVIKAYADSLSSEKIIYELQTNGVFDKEVCHWLGKNINKIWISIDGPPDIQNSMRPCLSPEKKTSDIIERNIRILKRYKTMRKSDLIIGARATITQANIDRMKDIVNYYIKLGVDAGWVHHLFPVIGKTASHTKITNNLSYNLLEFAKKYIEAQKYAKKRKFFFGNFLAINFDEEVEIACRACIPAPYLTTDGYISACDEAYLGSNPLFKQLIIGRYDSKTNSIEMYDNIIQRLQNRKVGNIPDCRGCIVEKHCAGHCLGECNMCNGDIYKPRNELCGAIKYLASKLKLNCGRYSYFHP